RLRRTRSTILRTCRGWQEEQLQTRRRGTGRPRSTQKREDRLLRRSAVQDPWDPSRSVGINWSDFSGAKPNNIGYVNGMISFFLMSLGFVYGSPKNVHNVQKLLSNKIMRDPMWQ
ncbi:hypothetical protein BDFB_008754, partial [Asbolus verrucosus]